jgi:hypothetical protein
MPARHYVEFELLDYSESKSSFSLSIGAITAVSLPGFLTQLGALRAALSGIVVGEIRRERWVGDETILSNIPPSNSNAQRELSWLVEYAGASNDTGIYECSVACPDLSLLGTDGHEADYSDPAIAAFITAFEAIARMPYDDTESVIVDGILLKGRRN